jgi:hypothetical protein
MACGSLPSGHLQRVEDWLVEREVQHVDAGSRASARSAHLRRELVGAAVEELGDVLVPIGIEAGHLQRARRGQPLAVRRHADEATDGVGLPDAARRARIGAHAGRELRGVGLRHDLGHVGADLHVLEAAGHDVHPELLLLRRQRRRRRQRNAVLVEVRRGARARPGSRVHTAQLVEERLHFGRVVALRSHAVEHVHVGGAEILAKSRQAGFLDVVDGAAAAVGVRVAGHVGGPGVLMQAAEEIGETGLLGGVDAAARGARLVDEVLHRPVRGLRVPGVELARQLLDDGQLLWSGPDGHLGEGVPLDLLGRERRRGIGRMAVGRMAVDRSVADGCRPSGRER